MFSCMLCMFSLGWIIYRQQGRDISCIALKPSSCLFPKMSWNALFKGSIVTLHRFLWSSWRFPSPLFSLFLSSLFLFPLSKLFTCLSRCPLFTSPFDSISDPLFRQPCPSSSNPSCQSSPLCLSLCLSVSLPVYLSSDLVGSQA